eukprot:scaffold1075_cov246-Chaetoceros_neogracile.AAC.7
MMMMLNDYEASWNNNEMMGIRVTDPNDVTSNHYELMKRDEIMIHQLVVSSKGHNILSSRGTQYAINLTIHIIFCSNTEAGNFHVLQMGSGLNNTPSNK